MRELEICVETLAACETAAAGGADRVELCAALSEGGVTPSRGFLREAVAAAAGVPVHALIRPRSGDFVYSAAEFRMVCGDLEEALAAGAAGVVVGVLTEGREVDRARMEEVVRLTGGRAVTFHRAFDRTRSLMEALTVVIEVGCGRVLTSGGEPTVMDGMGTLRELVRTAEGQVRIAAGGGVRLSNAARLVEVAGLDLHASLLAKVEGSGVGDPLWDEGRRVLSVEAVRALSEIVHGALART